MLTLRLLSTVHDLVCVAVICEGLHDFHHQTPAGIGHYPGIGLPLFCEFIILGLKDGSDKLVGSPTII